MVRKVVLGLSDGVDSAVAARVLQEAGWEVHGVYLDIAGENARRDAEESARTLGVDLTVVDIHAELEERVCAPFARAYLEGRTPNPCTGCNPTVKLPALWRRAEEIGAEKIATGHYVRTDGENLYMGAPDNDQSYMLCRLTREQIRRLLLPLGEYDKPRVRAMAAEMGLKVAAKPDSRENCFIKGQTYAQWLEARGVAPGPGPAVFRGEEIGAHEGIHRYTVGQRWPEMRDGRRLYVAQIDAAENRIELCLWEDLFHREFDIVDVNWIDGRPEGPVRAAVRVRHTRWETPECTVVPTETGAHILADEPLRAPARGQTAALYDGARLIGGGTID